MSGEVLERLVREFVALRGRVAALEIQEPRTPACRVYHTVDQSVSSGSLTTLGFDSKRYDTHNQHFTASGALTGTVTKTASSPALVGAGTLFLSQLVVGQPILVPGGGATERCVVIAISDNTHLTVNTPFAYSAGGQVASYDPAPLVCRQAGKYLIFANALFSASTIGYREMRLLNNVTIIGRIKVPPHTASSGTTIQVVSLYELALWDSVTVVVQQDSGSALAISAEGNFSPEFGWVRVG